ncbi:MAG: hypothetical protein ACR2O4_11810 [Hyphomicrobiaceae bacterium]
MSIVDKKILCVAYGGGHMRMLVPVALELEARGAKPLLFPLNTAVKDASASALPMTTLSQVLGEMGTLDELCELGRTIVCGADHPAVSDEDTFAYHGMGLHELAAEHGLEEARARFRADGRTAFEPVRWWCRIVGQIDPDIVVTTNAPRSETAALKAARSLDIPSLCVSDHLIAYEVDYLSKPGHGDLVTVLGTGIAKYLASHGRPEDEIRVTGNPAFDSLANQEHKRAGEAFRQALNWGGKHVLLWPQQSKGVQVGGKPLIPSDAFGERFKRLLARDSGLRLIVRPHPNNTTDCFADTDESVVEAREEPIEVLIHACDTVVQQSTTVGISAALAGKRVVTVGNNGMPPFAEYGIAHDIPELDPELASAAWQQPSNVAKLGAPELGTAARNVANVIEQQLS